MLDAAKPVARIDEATGRHTTGHEWDGIEELNNPLPRWWLYILYATIVWSIGYWIVYPAWPLVSDYTRGVFGFSQRAAIIEEMQTVRSQRDAQAQGLAKASLEEVRNNPDMLKLALAIGKAAFGDNCASCHGAGATGQIGYPNLQDDDWLWGGTLADIERTIRYGVRSSHSETRLSEMPAFGGRDGLLKRTEIETVANYVLSLSGKAFDPKLDLADGAKIYAQSCASCHGEKAKGNREVGAPDLTDAIWLYGSKPEQVIATIVGGRKSVMPAWEERLDATTIRSLALYIHSLGGGK
ncbi:cytochrome-c oxidase, cbb3-type subunit III [Terrarubrum flagellatum]|uniref:cytochrome-c oxidase, cbb3-type subunit III n=1 Tax=Terrirubrum flagellatum TaxID=2895980 RepID=UPI0031453F11